MRRNLQLSDLAAAIELFELNVSTQPDARPRTGDIARLQTRLDSYRYDSIVVLSNPALELFLQGKLKTPDQTPIVFSSYWESPRMKRAGYLPNMTGITMPLTNRMNIQLGMKLFPTLRKIVVLTNPAADGQAVAEQLESYRADISFPGELTILSGSAISTEKLLTYLKHLPADSLILYNDWFTSDDGPKLSRSTLQEKLLENTPHVPLLINTDSIPLQRQFAIGGVMVSGEKLGARTGELLQQVLRGASPSSLPIREMETEQRFDHRKLQAFGISSSRLPSGSVVLNRPPSFSRKYADILLRGSMVLGGLLLGLLAGLSLGAGAVLRWKEKKPSAAFSVFVVLFYVAKLFRDFRHWEINPAILDYCFSLFAMIAFMLASYHAGAFSFERGARRRLAFYSLLGVLFGAVSLAGAQLPELLIYAGSVFWMLACAQQMLRRSV